MRGIISKAWAAVWKELDAQTAVLVSGLALAAYGSYLVVPALGFLVPGLVLIWWTLPARPPFLIGPPKPTTKNRRRE